MLELQTLPREASENLETLRNDGKIPAVFYSAGKDTVAISVPELDFIKVYREAGESTMITLAGAGNGEQALVQDIQVHPVSGKVLHIDFKVIEAGKPIQVTVPLEFIGVSPMADSGEGVLNKTVKEIEIEVLPKDLPQHIDVDVSGIASFEDRITAADIKLPSGATLMTDPETTVVSVSGIKEEVEEEPAGDIDFSQIEATKESKPEEGEAPGEEKSE